jgi:hypothetical protein
MAHSKHASCRAGGSNNAAQRNNGRDFGIDCRHNISPYSSSCISHARARAHTHTHETTAAKQLPLLIPIAPACLRIHACIHTHTHTRAYTRARAHAHTHTHMHTHMHTNTHVHYLPHTKFCLDTCAGWLSLRMQFKQTSIPPSTNIQDPL